MSVLKNEVKKYLIDLSRSLDGICDTIRSGDDGFEENIQSQVRSLKGSIKDFLVMHVEDPEQETDHVHPYYVRASEKLIDKLNDGLSPEENIIWHKSRVYAYLKRMIRESTIDWSTIKNDQLAVNIECLVTDKIIQESFFGSMWTQSSYQVVDDIVQEIIKKRKAQPQFKMDFTKVTNNEFTHHHKSKIGNRKKR